MANKLVQRRKAATSGCVSLEGKKYFYELEKLLIVLSEGKDLYKYQEEFIQNMKKLHTLENYKK